MPPSKAWLSSSMKMPYSVAGTGAFSAFRSMAMVATWSSAWAFIPPPSPAASTRAITQRGRVRSFMGIRLVDDSVATRYDDIHRRGRGADDRPEPDQVRYTQSTWLRCRSAHG